MKPIVIILLLSNLFWSCQKDEEETSGTSLGVPAMEPPVTRNTPSALTAASLRFSITQQAQVFEPLSVLRNRVFAKRGDCTGLAACALRPMDNRMAELEKRSLDSVRTCTKETGTSFTESRLPGDVSFSYVLQCGEVMASPSSIHLGFGIEGEWAYIRETQISTGVAGIIGKINKTTGDVEAWIIDTSKAGSSGDVINSSSTQTTRASVIHISTNEAAGALEMVIAANDNNSADYGCGFHLKSNKSLVYIKGTGANGFATSATCSDSENDYEACFDASGGVEKDLAECESASLNVFSLADFDYQDINETELQELNQDSTVVVSVTDFNQSE